MTKETYKEYIPANARISIDYTKKKNDRVNFSYPVNYTYKKAVWKFTYQLVVVLTFLVLVYSAVILYFLLYLPYSYITNPPVLSVSTSSFDMATGFAIIGGFFIILGIPAIITFYLSRKKERLANWSPRIGHYIARMLFMTKLKTFHPEEVKDKKVVIPSFNNVHLKWNAKDDFGEYLEKIDVTELDFSWQKRLLFKKWVSRNEVMFQAVFTFSDYPKTGVLDVEFV